MYDNANIPNVGLQLRIHGKNVNGLTSGCGTNSVEVHVAPFAEDSDRESPTYNAATGIGIAPEAI